VQTGENRCDAGDRMTAPRHLSASAFTSWRAGSPAATSPKPSEWEQVNMSPAIDDFRMVTVMDVAICASATPNPRRRRRPGSRTSTSTGTSD
jgi:hypothetical protein